MVGRSSVAVKCITIIRCVRADALKQSGSTQRCQLGLEFAVAEEQVAIVEVTISRGGVAGTSSTEWIRTRVQHALSAEAPVNKPWINERWINHQHNIWGPCGVGWLTYALLSILEMKQRCWRYAQLCYTASNPICLDLLAQRHQRSVWQRSSG